MLVDKQLCMNLHHTAVWVADVQEAFHRYEMLLGLHGEMQADGTALMRCMHEDYCLVLIPASDEQKPCLNYVAYELRSGLSVAEVANHFSEMGVEFETITVPLRGV